MKQHAYFHRSSSHATQKWFAFAFFVVLDHQNVGFRATAKDIRSRTLFS